MPLVGVIDPTHDERRSHDNGRYPRWMTVDEVLNAAAVASPKWSPWVYELISACMAEHQERDYVSVTTLTGGCKRGKLVERKMDYIGKLDDMYAAFKGTMIHRVLEGTARPGSIAEWRFHTTVDGHKLSCSPDLITYDTVWDYKTTENPPAYGYMWEDHKLQLQFNRFVFNHAESWVDTAGVVDRTDIPLDPHHTRIQHLAIVYLGPKGPKVIETQKPVQAPKRGGGGTKTVKVPDVWTDEKVLSELLPRLNAWKLAWDSFPAWPAGLENMPGWEGPPEFRCSGPPLCYLPNCLAKRYPDNLIWQPTL